MTVADIKAAIQQNTFLDSELRDINEVIVTILKRHRKEKINEAKLKFRVGDKVTFQHKTGTITKINRTKCVVDCGGIGMRWTVPMTMLTAA